MIIELQAWSRKTVSLPAETATALERSGLVDVRPGATPGEWEIASDSRVGVCVAEVWELRVHPKLGIPKLLFLLAYARCPDGWRGLAGFGRERQLLDAVANGFAAQCQKAFERGLLRGYTPIEETRTDLRGRVRFGDQIARAGGLPLPVEVSYDNYTEDIPENRLLLTAAELLLRLPRIGERARPQLLAARAQLDAVRLLRDRREFKKPPVTRLNKRYEAAMTLAELILNHASVTARQGQVASAAFVFDLNTVFEDFVSTALKEALQPYGGDVRFQHPDRLDTHHPAALRLKPDITWWSGGRCLAVIDAKHKSIAHREMPNADAYQMLAYCTALKQRQGFLVYAKDSGEQQRRHVIRNSPYTINVHTLDIENEPETLLTQVDKLATTIAATTRLAPNTQAA
ncbi:MAG: restriction endonuclease [Actinomycetia bacterium]|nr:restriction endonuclease [Actinomycetes bacterium]